MDALPMDIQQYIYNKVDRVEHIKALIDGMSIKDFNEIMAVHKHLCKRINASRSELFHDLKAKWNEMRKENKKKGLNRRMYIEVESRTGNVELCVDKFAIKNIYAKGDGKTWTIMGTEYIQRYWIE